MRNCGVLLLAACVVVAGCDDSPSSPSDQPVVLRATLSAANEVPPVTGAESTGTGTATITFNVTRDSANAITAGTADFSVQLANLPSGSTVTLAHIHTGAAGANGNILVDTGLTPVSPITIGAAGTGTITRTGVAVATGATIQSIIDNPAGFYFNVHTALNPGGAVRGQLTR